MLMTFQKKREEEFLDECTEYCQRELLSRLSSADTVSRIPTTGSVAASAQHTAEAQATGKPGKQKRWKQQQASQAKEQAAEPILVEPIEPVQGKKPPVSNKPPKQQKPPAEQKPSTEQKKPPVDLNQKPVEEVTEVEIIDDPLNW